MADCPHNNVSGVGGSIPEGASYVPPGVPTCAPGSDISQAPREPLVAQKFCESQQRFVTALSSERRPLLPSDELYIFPLLGKNQSVGVIPGLYGNSNQSNCKTSTNGRCRSPAQDRFNTAKLQGYWD